MQTRAQGWEFKFRLNSSPQNAPWTFPKSLVDWGVCSPSNDSSAKPLYFHKWKTATSNGKITESSVVFFHWLDTNRICIVIHVFQHPERNTTKQSMSEIVNIHNSTGRFKPKLNCSQTFFFSKWDPALQASKSQVEKSVFNTQTPPLGYSHTLSPRFLSL